MKLRTSEQWTTLSQKRQHTVNKSVSNPDPDHIKIGK